ncbi:MAG: UDP-N-acetylmuramate dehydrogenase [Ginsengibacter sp.]
MKLSENFSLKPYNTFRLDAYAKYFAEFSSVEMLQEVLEENGGLQKMILGGGSNILLTKNVDGLVLKNGIEGIRVVGENETFVFVQVGAGVNWHQFVMYCIDHNYAGIENLSLIPGNTGASPMQNIGAYGVEIKDVFHELEALHLQERTLQTFSNADCKFGYRESVFKKKYKGEFAILNVTFRLNKKSSYNISYGAIEEELKRMHVGELNIKAVSDAVIHIRRSKLPDPEVIGNAGSFFKNPEISVRHLNELKLAEPGMASYKINEQIVKVPAGWLIERCGWKGFRKGDAGCYDKQALVLVNYGKATGREIYDLSEEIKLSVMEKFKIEIEREVNIL